MGVPAALGIHPLSNPLVTACLPALGPRLAAVPVLPGRQAGSPANVPAPPGAPPPGLRRAVARHAVYRHHAPPPPPLGPSHQRPTSLAGWGWLACDFGQCLGSGFGRIVPLLLQAFQDGELHAAIHAAAVVSGAEERSMPRRQPPCIRATLCTQGNRKPPAAAPTSPSSDLTLAAWVSFSLASCTSQAGRLVTIAQGMRCKGCSIGASGLPASQGGSLPPRFGNCTRPASPVDQHSETVHPARVFSQH